MMILVTGGAGSGKSGYAEQYIGSLGKNSGKYYIATMNCSDEESLRRVEKHRMMRKGMGFITIEQPVDIEKALEKICETQKTVPGFSSRVYREPSSVILLECVSNLTANEMFKDGIIKGKDQVSEKIVSGIKRINENSSVLVAVTNNIFEDGFNYDSGTEEYISALGMINRQLADMADKVVEVVCGIPVTVKEEA